MNELIVLFPTIGKSVLQELLNTCKNDTHKVIETIFESRENEHDHELAKNIAQKSNQTQADMYENINKLNTKKRCEKQTYTSSNNFKFPDITSLFRRTKISNESILPASEDSLDTLVEPLLLHK